MNFVADTYMGCPHGCWYCYAPSFAVRGSFEDSFPKFRNFRRRINGERDFEKIAAAIEDGKAKGTCSRKQEEYVAEALKHRHPLRIGSVSEPFGIPLEKQHRDTYKVLEMLIHHDYPFVICTKSPLVATGTYVNLLKSTKKAGVQISLVSLDDNLLQSLESSGSGHTPSARSRFDALKKLSDEGIFTTCRIQPVIPQVTEDGMKDLIFALAEAGVNHVIVEFLWLPLVHGRKMSARIKLALDSYCVNNGRVGELLRKNDNDLYTFYRSFEDYRVADGRLFYSRSQINKAMTEISQIVSEANSEFNTNMSFGSGNEETTYLNSTNNCCGVDRIDGFAERSPCTVHRMFQIAREKGKVTLDEIKELYNPYSEKIIDLWNKEEKKGYFIENRVFKIKGKVTDSGVEYVYDETLVPA
jgi:DNA repair photolyase